MTNKELADRLEEYAPQVFALSDILLDAASRLREIPGHTPEPLTLRALVEKHECLRSVLEWGPTDAIGPDPEPWAWWFAEKDYCWLTTPAAITVVRGIVKAKCDEASDFANWHPLRTGKVNAGKWSWYCGSEGTTCHTHCNDELEAIDALLTAMQ